jgi:hypothetical protein
MLATYKLVFDFRFAFYYAVRFIKRTEAFPIM